MSNRTITRRSVLKSGLGISLAASMPFNPPLAAQKNPEFLLKVGRSNVALGGKENPETAVWCYNDMVPGSELRVRQGERLKFVVENNLDEETTVHAHGIRMPNSMDGVPHVTQKPIAPGETFTYEFDAPDAGTYWYHPHSNSAEQIARGLYGALIVEEHQPIEVDRDITWVLDDWRLLPGAIISEDFGNRMEAGMDGRLGNYATINGKAPENLEVRAGERIRLRIINTATARLFGLDFVGHRPQVITYDGQPVEPHEPQTGIVIIGPAMRIDLIIDMENEPNQTTQVIDRFYSRQNYKLLDIVYSGKSALRTINASSPIQLPPNPIPEPDIENAIRHEVKFGGGMMNGGAMGSMMSGGKMWTINGIGFDGPVMEPLLTLDQGRSHVMTLRNETAWYHPIHLHGHSFRVIARNGMATKFREWQDTVLIPPRETADIALVADNPGDWMFHCHIAEHLASGMMGIVRVA